MSDGRIPVVDLEDFFSESRRNDFIHSVGSALEGIGFFALKNHKIEKSFLDELYQVSSSFFEQSDLVKKGYERPEVMRQRGYTSFGTEHAKDSSSPDLKEFYMVTRENNSSSPYGRNVWPNNLPAFKSLSLKLFKKLDDLAQILLRCCAQYLGEESNLFTDMTVDSDTILRLIHYPPIKGKIPEGSIRSGAHEDINLITLLCSSTARGLELLRRDGSWLSVETGSEYIVVDSGDMIQRLTNGLFKSTTHRVVNPPDLRGRRFSMPFFVHPRKEVDLSPLVSCVSKSGGQPNYSGVTAGSYLEDRLKKIGIG